MPATILTPPSEFLAACPKFRILVLGSPESTKQELFTKIFGVDLEKILVDEGFSSGHDIEEQLSLHGQNARLAIHTCLNFGTGDKKAYARVRDFLVSRSTPSTQQEDRIHCIWYCVASEEDRAVSELEEHFFSIGRPSAAPGVPLILVFTKYDEFVSQVQLDWSREAQQQGLSKVAVSHILRDLSAKKFEQEIGRRWDNVLGGTAPRVCVSEGDEDDDARSLEELTEKTLASLRERSVRYAFSTAQRNSAMISTRFAADTASSYFEVDTGHARKLHGIDMRDILPNFFLKAIQLFNLRDPTATLVADPSLLRRALNATFVDSQKALLDECLRRSSTESGSLLLNLTPHERAVLLTQALAGAVLFLHQLADAQWPHDVFLAPYTLTPSMLARQLDTIQRGGGGRAVLEMVEASTVFSECTLPSAVADLIVKAVQRAADRGAGGHHPRHGESRAIVVEDDSELQEISLSFVNDHKAAGDVVLPCGLTILPLT
ncbi:hypothetical protein C8A05DRAFT_12704 [Staphylotrichum tortipilum]|uniref:Uncharacterized protein n=1 Tax=Staphylotrichum tortipilum TaxID=2831512 RepID=A0AAN6MQZ3_9PEZI|nr:hypothetical protein C8A05DRAFT_12704 [Staphylotrichum longicolle]